MKKKAEKKLKINVSRFKKKHNTENDDSDGFNEAEADTSPTFAFYRDPTCPAEEDSSSDDEAQKTRQAVIQQNRKKKKSGGFQAMGLSHAVFKAVMKKGYKVPTPIQRKTIPIIMDGKDMVAMARTGSGKTAAFLIPLFERLQRHSSCGARALLLAPTRELALQTLSFTKELGRFSDLKAAVILGGDSMDDQFEALHNNPDIIIATPGRLLHVVMEMNLRLNSMEYVVFDEADRLFEMGFQQQLSEILHRLPETRQTLLFSATLPGLLVDFAKAGLSDPTLIRLDVDAKISEHLKTSFLQCRADDKTAVLLHLLERVIPQKEQAFVFLATRHHVDYLAMILDNAGISYASVYSSLDPVARKIAVAKFQRQKSRVLLVTDLAARGIDIPALDNVINYNFPAKAKLFVHRVGRVARAGRPGAAFSLVAPDEMSHLLDLHLFLGRPLKRATLKMADDPDTQDGVFGSVPQTVVDDVDLRLRQWHSMSLDLQNQKQVASNAQKKYLQTCQAASAESIKRIKSMNRINDLQLAVHPLLGNYDDDMEKARSELLSNMRVYKSHSTVFEINKNTKNVALAVMRDKRQKHQRIISSNRKRLQEHPSPDTRIPITQDSDRTTGLVRNELVNNQSGGSKKKATVEIRDTDYYLSYLPMSYKDEKELGVSQTFTLETADATFDMTGDDDRAIHGGDKKHPKWDRKRKKFVAQGGNEHSAKKILTESGAWIPASYKSKAYKQWCQKSKVDELHEANDIADNSDDEPVTGKQQEQEKMVVMGMRDRNKHCPGNKDPSGIGKRKRRSEIKRPEEIIKDRHVKAKKQAFQQKRQKQKTKRRQISGASKKHKR